MKEKYKGLNIHYANQWVKEFKPRIEERTGIKLEDIVVRDIESDPEFDIDYHSDARMFVTPRYRNAIFMNEKKYEDNYGFIPIDVAHELVHLAHDYLIREGIKKTKFLPLKVWKIIQYYKLKSFKEGFAEYMSLDNLTNLYGGMYFDEELKRKGRILSSYRDFPVKSKPYAQGYKFFKKVLSVIGKDKYLEVAKSPPISEIEVKIPLLYLLRRYPLQGVKNIPKFFTRSIKTKILKKKYGHAPFDFVEKGSGKGKVVKALPT